MAEHRAAELRAAVWAVFGVLGLALVGVGVFWTLSLDPVLLWVGGIMIGAGGVLLVVSGIETSDG